MAWRSARALDTEALDGGGFLNQLTVALIHGFDGRCQARQAVRPALSPFLD
jgi:hypothetical protein